MPEVLFTYERLLKNILPASAKNNSAIGDVLRAPLGGGGEGLFHPLILLRYLLNQCRCHHKGIIGRPQMMSE